MFFIIMLCNFRYPDNFFKLEIKFCLIDTHTFLCYGKLSSARSGPDYTFTTRRSKLRQIWVRSDIRLREDISTTKTIPLMENFPKSIKDAYKFGNKVNIFIQKMVDLVW